MTEPTNEPIEQLQHHSFMEMFDELTFREKVKKVMHGLKQPHDSGEYKYAKLQMIRLSAPASAVVLPLLTLLLLVVFVGASQVRDRTVEVTMIDPTPLEKLDKIEEIVEPITPPDPVDVEFTPDMVAVDTPAPVAPDTPFSPKPAPMDTVAIVKSPVIMRGIYGSRNPGARGSALGNYGGSGLTEGAVLRALRWLKKNQAEDGSWPKNRHAMTGMALLCFLAHGETPASEEFGQTVEKAIRWLLSHQGGDGAFPRRYEHAIATYALCEAYGMTKVPMLKEPAQKAIDIIIKGQTPVGGWRYGLVPTEENDTSCMGWCAQALKAAKMAGIEHSDLDASMKKAVKGFQSNAAPSGGFGYTGPGATGLTGVGVLCMQLLGAAKEGECVRGLQNLSDATFNWDPQGGGKYNKNYYWYYITQAKFHAGGPTWEAWNKMFAMTLVKNQKIEKAAIADPSGKMQDIGSWDVDEALSGNTGGNGVVMTTALCCLQLEVYYRYLPTYKPPEPAEAVDAAKDDGDIKVDIKI